MPRRPLRQGIQKRMSYFSKPQFLTFSPFASSVSLFASKRPSNSKSRPKTPSQSRGNHALKEKIQQPESSDEDEHEDTVQADFAFFDPKPDDFHGVKILLQTYLNNEQWDLSSFVDLILRQTKVGTVIKIDDEEDDGLFSVITALNLGRYKEIIIRRVLRFELSKKILTRYMAWHNGKHQMQIDTNMGQQLQL